MTKAQKLLDAMAANPRDWRIEQVETVVRAYGLTIHCPGGSHHIVRNAAGKKVSIPAHRPIKPILHPAVTTGSADPVRSRR